MLGKPRILLLSAYDAGSHKRWREQLVASQPDFEWQQLALPPRFFRWRIRGNALSWLDEPALQQQWDLLIVTSMVDLTSVRAFHPHLALTPALLFMHENQFAYPPSHGQHSSAEPQMVNLYSAITADCVLFNSDWNRRSFLQQAGHFLDKMPDELPDNVLSRIAQKSQVLPVPIEDSLFRKREAPVKRDCPHLLWNHRWEYDKGPDRLLLLLKALAECGQEFSISIVGEQFRRKPQAFAEIRKHFETKIRHWGYIESQTGYRQLLATADIVISTALHDFQGLAMLEAMASGCLALAPDRLAYPEYIPAAQCYRSDPNNPVAEAQDAARCLVNLLETAEPESPDAWRLSNLSPQYEQVINTLLN